MTVSLHINEAKLVLDEHIKALNARDEIAIAKTLHFPHYRLSEGKMKIWETADDYFKDFKKRAGDDWGYTKWGEVTVLQDDETKVHFKVRVDRYRPDDTLLVSFYSLWIISKVDGKWAAQFRSSFAKDSQNMTSTQK